MNTYKITMNRLVLTSSVQSRNARRDALARFILLLLITCGCQAKSFEALMVIEKNQNPSLSVEDLEMPSDRAVASTVNIFDSKFRQGTRKESDPKSSQSRPKTPSSVPAPLTKEPQSPLVLKATGITMILGGVEPLDNDSWLTWRKVTQSFIRADIEKTLKESVQVEVSISLLSQEPRFVETLGESS
jgi:hypothetical protein